jgi:hypothetical protein
MRSITVPERVLQQIAGGFTGTALYWPVEVDWPELRLTEEQQLANIGARLRGEPPPHDNHQIFTVVLPRVSTETDRLRVACRAALAVIEHRGEGGESLAALLRDALR